MRENMIDQIEKALERFNIKKTNKIVNEEGALHISNIESKYNITIPNYYKEFLLNYDNISFDDLISYTSIEKTPYTSDDGTELFDGFIPLKGDWNLQENMECYYKRMPESFIPVGECQGGDLICLGIKEPYLGKIYLWDHENELEGRLMVGENVYTEDINNYLDNLYFVSETLLDFI